MSNFLSNIVNFAENIKDQTKDYSSQSVKMMEATNKSINSTFVADPEAGSKQVAPEDAHPDQIKSLKQKILLNVSKTLSNELSSVGQEDYVKVLQFLGSLDTFLSAQNGVADILKNSANVLADTIMAHAVPMESGNTIDVLSSSEIKVLSSSMLQAGSVIRQEAPVITDTAFNRIILAHTLIEKADVMINKAVSMIQSVKKEFGISASDIALIASNNIKISGSRIDLNPTGPKPTPISFEDGGKVKSMTQLPQWDGMSPVPVFIPED